MSLLLMLHVAGGTVALLAGALALAAPKGDRMHRRAGVLFVGAMLLMAGLGATLALREPSRMSVIGGSLSCYLVITGFAAVRWPRERQRTLLLALLPVALGCAIASGAWALAAMRSGVGQVDGVPAPMGLVFATVAALGVAGDVRLLRAPYTRAAHRVARHLWRLTFAMWIATGSFFLGQAQVIPAPFRVMPVLATPVVLVLVLLLYWLVRTLWRPRRRALTPAPEI